MALFHLGELVLPVAGQLGLGQVLDAEAAQERHQLERLRAGHQLAAFAVDVLLVDQALDDRGARRRRAEAFFLHRLAQLVVVDQLAGAFHRRQQRRLGVARRRPRLQRLDVDAFGSRELAIGDRDQVGVVLLRLAAVDREPAGLTITLPLVWNLYSLPALATLEIRVVTMNSAGGKNTARKRLATMS